MSLKKGVTAIEIVSLIVLIAVIVGVSFFHQKTAAAYNRDQQRKIAINTMHQYLENLTYIANESYPQTINQITVNNFPKEYLKDPSGKQINTYLSDYSYIPTNCSDNICRHYTFRANLENESPFIVQSRH